MPQHSWYNDKQLAGKKKALSKDLIIYLASNLNLLSCSVCCWHQVFFFILVICARTSAISNPPQPISTCSSHCFIMSVFVSFLSFFSIFQEMTAILSRKKMDMSMPEFGMSEEGVCAAAESSLVVRKQLLGGKA